LPFIAVANLAMHPMTLSFFSLCLTAFNETLSFEDGKGLVIAVNDKTSETSLPEGTTLSFPDSITLTSGDGWWLKPQQQYFKLQDWFAEVTKSVEATLQPSTIRTGENTTVITCDIPEENVHGSLNVIANSEAVCDPASSLKTFSAAASLAADSGIGTPQAQIVADILKGAADLQVNSKDGVRRLTEFISNAEKKHEEANKSTPRALANRKRRLPSTVAAEQLAATNNLKLPDSYIIQGKVTVYCKWANGASGTEGPQCANGATVKNALGLALAQNIGTNDGYSVIASNDAIPTTLISALGPEVEPLLAALTPEQVDGCPGWTTFTIIVATTNPLKQKAIAAAWEKLEEDTSILTGLIATLSENPQVTLCESSVKHNPARYVSGSSTLTEKLSKPHTFAPTLTILNKDQKGIATVVEKGVSYVVVATNFPASSTVEVSELLTLIRIM